MKTKVPMTISNRRHADIERFRSRVAAALSIKAERVALGWTDARLTEIAVWSYVAAGELPGPLSNEETILLAEKGILRGVAEWFETALRGADPAVDEEGRAQ